MRLTTFNVEDLFRRPVALDQATWAEGRERLNDYTTFNGMSPAPWASVSAVGVERRSVWAPPIFPHFPEIGGAVEAAFDHATEWGDLP